MDFATTQDFDKTQVLRWIREVLADTESLDQHLLDALAENVERRLRRRRPASPRPLQQLR